MALVSVLCKMFVCVVSLSQPSSRDLVYPLWDGVYLGKKHKKAGNSKIGELEAGNSKITRLDIVGISVFNYNYVLYIVLISCYL